MNILDEQIWDAGTEVNDTMGAAFSQVGGMSTDENGVVHLLPSGGLSNFAGTFTAANSEITNLFTPGVTVATITISTVPEPTSGLLISVARQIEVHLEACAIYKSFVKSLADSSELADA